MAGWKRTNVHLWARGYWVGSSGNVTVVSKVRPAATAGTLPDVSSHGASSPPRQIVHFKFFDANNMTPPLYAWYAMYAFVHFRM